jgi:hypothetical protein
MEKRAVVLGIVLTVLLPGPLRPQTGASEEAQRIVRRMDDLYRSRSSETLIEMDIVTPEWQRTLKMRAWSLGTDKTFIRILEPKKEEGIATLRLGNEMWNFLPNIDKVLKIPPSMMMSSWMGSDFTNDDLVKEYTFIESCRFEMFKPEAPEEGVLYVRCVPKEGLPIVWGSIVIAVREDGLMPVWEKYYDEKGRPMREIRFGDVKAFGVRRIPSVMELIPTSKEGHKTVIRYLEARFDIELSPEIFTLRNLHGGR